MDQPELERVTRSRVGTSRPAAGLIGVLILAVGVGVSSGSRLASPDTAASPSPTASFANVAPPIEPPAAATTSTPMPSADRPAWVDALAGQLDCDGPRADFGSDVEVPDGPADPVPTTEWALEALLSPGVYSSLPSRGFEAPEVDGHWVVYRYLVDGRLKAIAVGTDQFGLGSAFGWEVVGVRACDASEFDPEDGLTDDATLWIGADDSRARAARIFSRSGNAHCGWESAVFLHFEGAHYVRDPKGVLAESTVVSFDAEARLPEDAVDTGLHTDRWHLYTIPSGRAAFVKSARGRIERWPLIRQDGCA